MKGSLPAKVKRTGQRQLSITLCETQARYLETMRVESGLRSWGQVVRMLIADAMVNRHKAFSRADMKRALSASIDAMEGKR